MVLVVSAKSALETATVINLQKFLGPDTTNKTWAKLFMLRDA